MTVGITPHPTAKVVSARQKSKKERAVITVSLFWQLFTFAFLAWLFFKIAELM
jgi:hypothetical protein